jgi:hypothetical protein
MRAGVGLTSAKLAGSSFSLIRLQSKQGASSSQTGHVQNAHHFQHIPLISEGRYPLRYPEEARGLLMASF